MKSIPMSEKLKSLLKEESVESNRQPIMDIDTLNDPVSGTFSDLVTSDSTDLSEYNIKVQLHLSVGIENWPYYSWYLSGYLGGVHINIEGNTHHKNADDSKKHALEWIEKNLKDVWKFEIAEES